MNRFVVVVVVVLLDVSVIFSTALSTPVNLSFDANSFTKYADE